MPTSGTTSSVVSRVRRRMGLLVPVFLPTACWQLASTAQRQFRIVLCSPGLWGEGGYIYLDMSELTCGVAFDATFPEVALDMQKTVEIPQSQFINSIAVFPVAAQRQSLHGFPSCRTCGGRCPCCVLLHPCRGAEAFMVQTALRTFAIHQLRVDKMVDVLVVQVVQVVIIPVVAQRRFMVFPIIEIPLLPLDMVIDVPVEVVIILSWCRGRFPWSRLFSGSWRLPSCPVIRWSMSSVVTQRQIPMVMVTMKIPQLLFDKVVHVPVVQVERVPHMLAWRRQSCSGVSTASCGMKLIQDVLA